MKRVGKPTYNIVGPVQRVDRRGDDSTHGPDFYFVAGGSTKWHDLSEKDQAHLLKYFRRARFTEFAAYPEEDFPEPLNRYGWCSNNFRRFLASAGDGPLHPKRIAVPDPALMSERVKKLARDLGARLVGICDLNSNWVFRDYEGPIHRYAIAVLVNHIEDRIQSSPSWIADSSSWIAYDMAAKITVELAGCIREMGYPARASSTAGEHVLHPPILIDAGLGEQGRCGYCISPVIGPLFKSGIVTTDLPLQPDKPVDFGLQDFCSKCLKCYTNCPAQAIPREKTAVRGVEKWQVDTFNCKYFWVSNPQRHFACANCVMVCPWNKPMDAWYHRATRWAITNIPQTRSTIIRLDDLLGYGRRAPLTEHDIRMLSPESR